MNEFIKTQYYGNVKIVSRFSEKYYLKMLTIIEDSDGNYFEIWLHSNGYFGAIEIEEE